MSFLAPGHLSWFLVLPVLVLLWLRSPVALTARGKKVIAALRLSAVALLICALARPAKLIPDQSAKRSAVFLVDTSLSIPVTEAQKAREAVEQAARAAAKQGINAKVVLFGRRAFPVEGGVDSWDVTGTSKELSAARDGTDLEAALSEARAQVEPGEAGRVFLLTDGNATAGDLEAGLDRMRRAQLPVYTLPLEPVREPGVSVTVLEVPERAFAGDTIELVVKIESARAGAGKLTLYREGKVLSEQTVQYDSGTTPVLVRSEEKIAGLVRFRAVLDRVTVTDRYSEDNQAYGLCTVQAVPKVLIVTNRTQADDPFQAALRSQGINFEVWPAVKFPREHTALKEYSCVVFDDVPAKDFAPGALSALERFNKEMGGGFVMLGGKSSFAAGGYVKTPVERMLPVDMPTRSYSVSSGVILLLDNSGSMSGRPLFVAKESAKSLMRMLKGRMVGMWKFSSDAGEVFPPTLIGEDFSMIDARIDPIVPEGGTQFQPPLKAALAALEATQVENKYVILLSDGEPGDAYGLIDLVDHMKSRNIKVSTVGIGYNVDPQLMREIANKGSGRYHQPQNLDDLQKAFQDEASHIVEGTPVIEEPFVPKLLKSHVLVRGFKPGAFPTLAGYVGTTIKTRAEAVLASHNADPVLAVWRYGLGVSVAFTPDVGGPWSKAWVGWDGYARFWAQVIKGTFRSNESDFALRAQIRGQTGEVAVDAIDRQGAYLNFLPVFAQVTAPDGQRTTKLELPQRDPGRYENSFAALDRGFYKIEIYRADSDRAVAVGGAVMSASPEFQARPVATGTLTRIAQWTGGERLPGAAALTEAALAVPAGSVVRTRELWPPFVVLALLIFFCEIALRRAGTFTVDPNDASDGAALALQTAESFLRMAKDLDAAGDHRKASDYYLKAHSQFLKARREEEAKRMWERYRLLEERRGA